MISTMLNRVPVNPRPLESQLGNPTRGTTVHPTGGLMVDLCELGTRFNRVLVNPERDGGRRLVEPNGPHYLNLPPAIQHPVVEALAPQGASHMWVRRPVAQAVQTGVNLLLGVLACAQIVGLMAVGRNQEAVLIMMTHGTQLSLLATTSLSVATCIGILWGVGLL